MWDCIYIAKCFHNQVGQNPPFFGEWGCRSSHWEVRDHLLWGHLPKGSTFADSVCDKVWWLAKGKGKKWYEIQSWKSNLLWVPSQVFYLFYRVKLRVHFSLRKRAPHHLFELIQGAFKNVTLWNSEVSILAFSTSRPANEITITLHI